MNESNRSIAPSPVTVISNNYIINISSMNCMTSEMSENVVD